MKSPKMTRRDAVRAMAAFAASTSAYGLIGGRAWGDSAADSAPQIQSVVLPEGQPGVVKLDPAVRWAMVDGGKMGAELEVADGLLHIQPQKYHRPPSLYPFNKDLIWNVPIGDQAVYQAPTLDNETRAIRSAAPPPLKVDNSAYPWLQNEAMQVFQASPEDPMVRWSYAARPVYLPWPHKDDPGTAGGKGTFEMRTPADFRGLTVDGWAILIDESRPLLLRDVQAPPGPRRLGPDNRSTLPVSGPQRSSWHRLSQ